MEAAGGRGAQGWGGGRSTPAHPRPAPRAPALLEGGPAPLQCPTFHPAAPPGAPITTATREQKLLAQTPNPA